MVFDPAEQTTHASGRPPNEVECPEPVEGQRFVYILQCCDGSYYVGSTSNMKDRLRRHRLGEAASWTAERRPVRLVYVETQFSELQAMRREVQIKKWAREKKEKLIVGLWKAVPPP